MHQSSADERSGGVTIVAERKDNCKHVGHVFAYSFVVMHTPRVPPLDGVTVTDSFDDVMSNHI
tara:strand:+ start:1589 stop:1777 length:189 start_codon:yes stop_codon:yes gene_type:complete